jgi:hypothetical protein
MEDGKITVKRIKSYKIREDRPPMIVILSNENIRYYYEQSSSDVSKTLEDLILAEPGDELKIRYSIKKAFLDKDSQHKIFDAEIIFD